MSIMTDNSNISIVDIGVTENVPTDAPEPWTMTMYVCLFIGGFWWGAMTFLMILVVNMYWEQREVRWYRGQPWPLRHSGQNGAAPWQVNLLEEEGRSPLMMILGQVAHPLMTLYEEVIAHTSDIEYAEVMDWDSDMQAIHYWRPFEDSPLMKTFGHNLNGECCKIYLKDPAGSRLQTTGGTCHDALRETMRVRWRWGTRDSGGI